MRSAPLEAGRAVLTRQHRMLRMDGPCPRSAGLTAIATLAPPDATPEPPDPTRQLRTRAPAPDAS